jgi:protein Mpv17
MDQAIGAPLFCSLILFNLNLFETRSVKNAISKTSNIVGPVLLTNYKFWPFIQLVNLTVVPIQFRVVLVQFCSIFWNMYISYMQHNQATKKIDIIEVSD